MTQEAKHVTGGRAVRSQVVYGGKRMPGLYERKTGEGQVRYEAAAKRNGRVVRRTLAATTATDAIREQRKFIASLDSGARVVGRNDVSLRELRDEWEPWARGPGSNYAARTVTLYCELIERHAFRVLGAETKAAALTPTHLRRLIDKLNAEGHSGSYVHGNLTALSALLRYGVRRGVIESNPTRLLERGDRPSAKRLHEPRYLDRKQIDALLAKMGDEFRPVAATLAFAALRVSEALALRWQDVDFNARMLNVPGTKTAASAQPVPMTADLVTELRAHRSRQRVLARLRPEALVFQTCNGRPHHRKNVLRAIYRAGDHAGLNTKGGKKVGCHDLRHSCAGLLLSAGVPAPKVAAILRHADARVTLTVYAGAVESQRAELRDDLEAALR
jgi:integrase